MPTLPENIDECRLVRLIRLAVEEDLGTRGDKPDNARRFLAGHDLAEITIHHQLRQDEKYGPNHN